MARLTPSDMGCNDLALKRHRFWLRQMQCGLAWDRLGNDSTMTNGITGRRLATNRVKPIFCRQNHQIRRIPHVQTVVLQVQGFRAVGGDQGSTHR